METHLLRGALFENFIIAEVAKAYLHHRRQPPLYFWQDRIGYEIDLLIDEGGALFSVEMKSGENPEGWDLSFRPMDGRGERELFLSIL